MTAVALLMLAAGPASAARVFYVGSNGADTASCGTITRPCRTIVYVLGTAVDGDRIVVGPGIYSGFQLDTGVSLESTHGAGATVIQGGEPVIDVSAGADGAVIGKPSQGFLITGGTVGVLVNAADVRIEDNVLVGVYTGVQGNAAASRLTVAGNLISASTGVAVLGAATSIVQNAIHGDGVGWGIRSTGMGVVVSDNVVTGARWGGEFTIGPATVRRNTFAANAYGVAINAGSLVLTSNNFLGNGTAGQNCGVFGSFPQNLSGNYWGSELGPGAAPANRACGTSYGTTPFLRAPVPVNSTGGR
jgi:hypothetical protein